MSDQIYAPAAFPHGELPPVPFARTRGPQSWPDHV